MMFLASIILFSLSLHKNQSSSIIIEWSTSSELDTAGYNLYRLNGPDTESIKVNERLIPASEDPLVGGEFSYEDFNITPGDLYYYELEEIEFSGASTRYGPIEATAERSGIFEFVMGFIFLFFSIIGLVLIIRNRNIKITGIS